MKAKSQPRSPKVTQLLTTIAPLNHMVIAPMGSDDEFLEIPWELHSTAPVPRPGLGGVELHILCSWVRKVPRDKALQQIERNKEQKSFLELGEAN